MNNSAKHPRLKLYLIVLITLLPIVVGLIMFNFYDKFAFNTLNHGLLINPPIVNNQLALEGKSKKQWQIVYMPIKQCQKDCQTLMFKLHQLRKALGKSQERITLTIIANEQDQRVDVHDFRKIIFTQQQFQQFNQLGLTHRPRVHFNFMSDNGKIFLVDPNANVFMVYPDDVNLMDVLKDVKRVLEVSQIG